MGEKDAAPVEGAPISFGMDFALPRQADAPAPAKGATAHPPGLEQECPNPRVGQPSGVSPGVNIAPGSDDDGWIVPEPARLADGTEVQLYKDGEALHAAYEAIASARRRVCMEVYIFKSDPTGHAFVDLMARRAREGLEVNVIYDAVGSAGSDPAMFAAMAAAGGNLREFHPWKPWRVRHSWRVFNRDHRKLVVADDETAVLGGQNLADEY